MKNKLLMHTSIILASACLSIILGGCLPMVAMSGAAGVGAGAVSEKGLSGTISDSKISIAIKEKIYKKDPELHQTVGVEVQNGEVLLTGRTPTQADHLAVLKMCWEVEGVKSVVDNIAVSKQEGKLSDVATDAAITTRIKTSTIFERDVHSLNYSIKTVGRVVYIMGIAQSREELNKIIDIAKHTPNVLRVEAHVKIKGEPSY